jgi:alpha-tubulin suppressor-like RCC1 family protein
MKDALRTLHFAISCVLVATSCSGANSKLTDTIHDSGVDADTENTDVAPTNDAPLVDESKRIVDVSVGRGFVCVLKASGSIACWGEELWYPGVTFPPEGGYSQISSSYEYSCALRRNKEIACWGPSKDGLTSPPSGQFVQVSASEGHPCALREDGSVACWGARRNLAGADPLMDNPPQGAFRQISVGYRHACGIRVDASIGCWGFRDLGIDKIWS